MGMVGIPVSHSKTFSWLALCILLTYKVSLASLQRYPQLAGASFSASHTSI